MGSQWPRNGSREEKPGGARGGARVSPNVPHVVCAGETLAHAGLLPPRQAFFYYYFQCSFWFGSLSNIVILHVVESKRPGM